MVTEQYDPINYIDTLALLVRARKLEFIIADLSKIAIETNLKVWGNPPDYEFRLRMKTGIYIGIGTDPKDAILMALKQAKEALGVQSSVNSKRSVN